MRRWLFILGTMLFAAGPASALPAEEPVLPLRIPGYELRSLDVRKPVVFEVAGGKVLVSLPIYLYYPTACADRREAVKLLRQAYGDMIRLGQREDWTAGDLRRILSALDASLSLLERNP